MVIEDLNGKSICWNITNKCNMQCDYCFKDIFGLDSSLEDNLRILDILKHVGVKQITFAGGEPTLYHGLTELLKKANELGIECRMITNGSGFYESCQFKDMDIEQYSLNYKLDDILPYLSKITFSCDYLEKDFNNNIGRKLNHDDIYDSSQCIFYLIDEIRKKYTKDDLKININSVVLRDLNGEYPYLDSMQEKMYSYSDKIDEWKLLIFYGLRGKAKDKKDVYDVPIEDVKRLKEYYTINTKDFSISVKDNDDMDKNIILSNDGTIKVSHKGKEKEVCNIKDYMVFDAEQVVVVKVISGDRFDPTSHIRRNPNGMKIDNKRKKFNKIDIAKLFKKNRGENNV